MLIVIFDYVQIIVHYAASWAHIKVSSNGAFGGLAAGTAGNGVAINDGTYEVNTAGSAFSFSETALVGEDTLDSMAIDATDGTLDTHNTYGILTTTTGGTKGSLAGTLSATGVASVTAGGQGTTALGQRTVTLTVFD